MSSNQQPDDSDEENDDGTADARDLQAQLDVLQEENRRLRSAHRRTLQTQHRRTALGLAGLGLVSLAAAGLFAGARTVLLALAGIGLFSGVLVYYLTPERFVSVSVSDRVYDAYAHTGAGLVDDLGLADHRVYVPTDSGARLFAPQHDSYELPEGDALDGVVVVTDDERRRGIAVHPTGAGLDREFQRTVSGDLDTAPSRLAEQLADGLVEAFELAESATADGEAGRLTIGVTDTVYGPIDAFDHPVPSFIGTGVATVLETPVTVTTTGADDDRVDALVTATWDPEGERT